MRRWIDASAGSPPPRGDHAATFAYGLAQPLLGLRMLHRHPDLLRPMLLPLVLVAAFCTLATFDSDGSPTEIVLRFYGALVAATSAPPFLFANTYSRVAARAHEHLGLGPAAPHRSRFVTRLRHLIRFALVVALPIAPVVWIVGATPVGGAVAAFAVSAAWTLHWIVVEALDSARVAGAPGGTPPEWPWFLAWAGQPGFARLPVFLRGPLAWLARRVRKLTRPWHEEAALVAAHPVLSTGFGVAVAALLAVPGVNLLLRPAVLVGSVHVLGRVRAPVRSETAQTGSASVT